MQYTVEIIFIAINLIAFLFMFIDKYNAEKKLWRLPENTIFILAIIGGAPGIFVGIYALRHKTKKPQFTILIPIIAIIELIAFVVLITFLI